MIRKMKKPTKNSWKQTLRKSPRIQMEREIVQGSLTSKYQEIQKEKTKGNNFQLLIFQSYVIFQLFIYVLYIYVYLTSKGHNFPMERAL